MTAQLQKAVPPHRPAREIADYGQWAQRVREQFGWQRGELGRTVKFDGDKALEQVAESRALRESGNMGAQEPQPGP